MIAGRNGRMEAKSARDHEMETCGVRPIVTYRPSFVSRERSFTFAKIASCVTRGMPSQIADAATHRSAS
jgi:hypothetical protein